MSAKVSNKAIAPETLSTTRDDLEYNPRSSPPIDRSLRSPYSILDTKRSKVDFTVASLWRGAPLRATPYFFAIFFVLYSYEINNFNISIDDERHAFSSGDFIPLGRWLFPLIQKTVWPQLVVPQAPYLIFGALISLTFCLILNISRQDELRPFHYVCFAAFVSFPVVAAQLEFAAHVIPIGVSFLCSALAVALTLNAYSHAGRLYWLNLFAAVLLCAIAAGVYQSAILNYPVILIPIVACRTFMIDDRRYAEAFRSYVAGFLVLAAATILYVAVAWLSITLLGRKPAAEYLSSAYLVPDQTILEAISARLLEFPRGMYLVIYDWWHDFGIAKYVFAFSVIFCATCIMVRATRSWKSFVAMGLVLGAIVLAPGALILVSGSFMPLRTFVAAPAALTMIFLLAYALSGSAILRNSITALLVLFVVQCMYIQSTQQARAWVTQRHDLLLAGALNHDILSAMDSRPGADIKLDFHGFRASRNPYPPVPTNVTGWSYFEWDEGNPVRMVLFMNLTGFYWYQAISVEERARLQGNYADMPLWPRPGSIRVVDDVVLVKLSE